MVARLTRWIGAFCLIGSGARQRARDQWKIARTGLSTRWGELPAANFDRPLLPVAAAVIIGIAIGVKLPGCAVLAWWAVCLVSPCIFLALWRKRSRVILPLLLCTSLGYLSIQPWLGIDQPQDHVSRYADAGLWQIQGKVQSALKLKPPRWEFLLGASSISNNTQQHSVRGLVKVTGRDDPPELVHGDVVDLMGRLKPIRNFANPGGFDFKRHMAFRRIHARVYSRKGSLKRLVPAAHKHWQAYLDDLRAQISQQMRLRLAGNSVESIALLQALTLGDRSHMTAEQEDAYRRAGVSHILAISGLHIGFVAAAAFAVGRWLLCWIPMMLQRALTRKGAAILSLSVVVVYGVMAGLSPSTQRAMIMVALFLASFWVGRRHDWFNALALAAIVVVIVHPPTLLSVSFQLSFSAILAIITGLRVIRFGQKSTDTGLLLRMIYRLLDFLWVSMLAIAGTLPLVLYYFNEISLVGLFTNLIVVPLVAMLVVPAGLFGILILSLSADLAAMCWQVSVWGLSAVEWLVALIANRPWVAVQCITPSIPEMILYYCLAGLCLNWKRIARPCLALVMILSLVGLDIGFWYQERFGGKHLRVTAVDVGQGSANLLELPGGFVALIDGGGFSDNRSFDVGERILAPLLWRKKIKTLDLVVLTHPNSDHLNGLLYLMEHFNVKVVWSNHETADTFGFRKWEGLLTERQTPHADFRYMPEIIEQNGVRFEILAPPSDFLLRQRSEAWRDSNNNSMVLRIAFGKVSILISGDIADHAEADLVHRHTRSRLSSTILMVPHHGSRKSSTTPFLSAVMPKEAVISAGWKNRFGFPHGDVLARLDATGSRIWCTSDHGAIQISTDGESYDVRTMRESP